MLRARRCASRALESGCAWSLLGLSEVPPASSPTSTVLVSANTRRWLPWVRTVIPNGVDLRRFHPGSARPHPSILFVGTYLRRKRGELLADAFEREVRPALPERELWMVCEDAPARPASRCSAASPTTSSPTSIGRAWVFCLPSSYEGFGIPYIEAMASGCPVVATRNPGAVEVTRNGELGLLVKEESLGDAIVALLQSPEERERLARAGLRASARYGIGAVAAAYEEIYSALLLQRTERV